VEAERKPGGESRKGRLLGATFFFIADSVLLGLWTWCWADEVAFQSLSPGPAYDQLGAEDTDEGEIAVFSLVI
jgi:hypothetical protein